jgi:acyl-CoA dehydrogenase
MDFELTEEQLMLKDSARKLGEKFGLEYWRDLDGRKEYPVQMWNEICNAGFCGVTIPEQYGGSGLGMLELAIAIEALCGAGGGSTLSQIFMLNPIFGGISLSNFANAGMRQELLPLLISGKATFAMGLTEPDAGSNTLAMRSFATRDGDGWLLNGQKIWITAVPQASKMLVVARTKKLEDVKNKTDGITLFMIDVEREGLEHSSIDKVGTNTLPSSSVFFDNVRLESNEIIGEEHRGFAPLLDVLNTERIVTSAGLIGTAQLAIDLAVNYASARKVFGGKPTGSYQAIQFPLAEAKIQLECAKLMNYKAASLYDNGQPYGSEANMGKFLAGKAAANATDRAMQTMGGMGYAKESDVERLWRDARLFRIAPVSEEMVLNFVAQHDLGMPRSY